MGRKATGRRTALLGDHGSAVEMRGASLGDAVRAVSRLCHSIVRIGKRFR